MDEAAHVVETIAIEEAMHLAAVTEGTVLAEKTEAINVMDVYTL